MNRTRQVAQDRDRVIMATLAARNEVEDDIAAVEGPGGPDEGGQSSAV